MFFCTNTYAAILFLEYYYDKRYNICYFAFAL
jgi:hypothetical protein